MSRVLFSVWFSIQGIIQNTTCSVWFRIQRIIKNCPGYYSVSDSVFRVLFKIRPAASGSGFSVLFRNVQGIIQSLVHDSAYYSKMSSVLLSVWFRVQRIIQKMFRVLFWRLVQDSSYYSEYYLKYDRHIIRRLVQDLGYYLKMSRVLFGVWFSIQGIIQNTISSFWFSRSGEAPGMFPAWPGLSGLNGAQAAGMSRESKSAQK